MENKENKFELVDELINSLISRGWLTTWANIPEEMKSIIKEDLDVIIKKHNKINPT